MAEVKSRTVLWYLVFIGFAVNYMIRINLNITIVEMIAQKPPAPPPSNNHNFYELKGYESNHRHQQQHHEHHHDHDFENQEQRQSVEGENSETASTTTMQQFINHQSEETSVMQSSNHSTAHPIKRAARSVLPQQQHQNNEEPLDERQRQQQQRKQKQREQAASRGSNGRDSKYSIERHLLNWTTTSYDAAGFHWNEYEQGLVLGSFFWAHWVTQIPGGVLAQKYGTKLVFGLSNAIGCWMCFLIPILSYFDYRAVILLRVLQGLITGLAWPAMHVMTAKWIPPNERSKFVTAYLGSSVGIAAFYPMFGYVMHWWSWEWVYHICGVLGSIWWFFWLYFVFDSPNEHPRITESERRYIEKSLGASVQHSKKAPTPWPAILTSKPVWMNVIAQWGGIWGLFTLMTQAPTYFRVIHNWNIRATGLLSGLPHLMRMIFAYGFSVFADFLLRTERMSRTNIRKLATAVCCIVNGGIVLALAYFGHNSVAAIVFLTMATMVHGAVSSGPLASIVDIAPNYAGIVLGISGMIGVLPGFISPYIVGILTLGNQTFESWKMVFIICASMLIGSGVLYVLFGDSTLQKWNTPALKEMEVHEKELQLLNESSKNLELTKSETKIALA